MTQCARLPQRNRAAGLEPQPVRALGKAPGIESDHPTAGMACREVERVRKGQTVPAASVRTPGTIPSALRTFLGITACPFRLILQQKLAALDELKKALLHQAFSGELERVRRSTGLDDLQPIPCNNYY